MTAVLPFSNGEFELRVIHRDGQPWFVAADVCATLGIGNARQAVSYLDDDEVIVAPVITNDGSGRELMTNVVSEPGLYSLILRSRKPSAKVFKRWVTHEVIPSIRATGEYSITPAVPQTMAQALRLAADQAEELERQAAEIAELEPKAQLADALLDASGDLSVREAAQTLTRDHGIDIGQNRLFDYLREIRWLDGKRMPYQQHIEAGRLAVFTSTFDHPVTGEPTAYTQVRVTPKGLAQLHGMLTAGRHLAAV